VTARKGPRELDVLGVIALGGGIGSIARYGLSRAMPTPPGGFPWATFLTNVIGCAVLGALMYLVLEVWPPSRYRRPFFGVGICGGFTTFSTAMVESRGLLAGGHVPTAFAYLAASLFAGLAAVAAGAALARLSGRALPRRGPAEPASEPVPVTAPTDGGQQS
jgi:CrcB protein